MKRRFVILLLLAAAIGGGAWWWTHRKPPTTQLTLFGNVDLRQVELAFNNSERIKTVLVQEGDHVHAGQLLAQLDTGRLEPQVAQAEAQAAAQRNVVERLHNGSRPEEIAQARSNVEAAQAETANARLQYDRMNSLLPTGPPAGRRSTTPRPSRRGRGQAGHESKGSRLAIGRAAQRRYRRGRSAAAS